MHTYMVGSPFYDQLVLFVESFDNKSCNQENRFIGGKNVVGCTDEQWQFQEATGCGGNEWSEEPIVTANTS